MKQFKNLYLILILYFLMSSIISSGQNITINGAVNTIQGTTLVPKANYPVQATLYHNGNTFIDTFYTDMNGNYTGQISTSIIISGGILHMNVYDSCYGGLLFKSHAAIVPNSNPIFTDNFYLCDTHQCFNHFVYYNAGNSQTFQFLPARTPSVFTYLWEFDDGTTDTSSSPIHTYSTAGTYLVKLTTTNTLTQCSQVDIEEVSVVLNGNCSVSLSNQQLYPDSTLVNFQSTSISNSAIQKYSLNMLTAHPEPQVITYGYNNSLPGSTINGSQIDVTIGFYMIDTFQVAMVVTDSSGCTATDFNTVIILDTANVIQLNNAPIAVNDNYTTVMNAPITGNILNNDSDPNGDALTTVPITFTFNGTLTLNPNGTFVYAPDSGHTGVDFFQYQVCDNGTPSLCDTATVYLNTGVLPSTVTTDTVYQTVPQNWQNYFSVNTSQMTGPVFSTTNLNCQPLNYGTMFVNTSTGFEYYSFFPSGTDTICVMTTDVLNGTVDTTIFIITVMNSAPIAVDDSYVTLQNTSVNGNLLTNDTDSNGDNIFILTTPITPPTNGSVVINADGTFTYMPSIGFVGSDSLLYSICDDGTPSLCDTAMVMITVTTSSSALQITNVSSVDEACSQGNGSIDIMAVGGTGLYEYSIDSQQTWQSSSSFGNLSAGVYHAFVRDGLDTVAYNQNPIIINDTLAPVIVNAIHSNDTLTINALSTQPLQYSIDCGVTWQNSNIFYPVYGGNICIGVRLVSGSCLVVTNVTLTNNPPVAVVDSVTFPQGGYQTLNVLQNDYDLENHAIFTVPQTSYYGADSLTLDSNGVMNVPTEAWNFGSYLIYYQACELNTPTNCSQGQVHIQIIPPTQTYFDTMAIGATRMFCIPNNLPGTPSSVTVISGFVNNIIDSVVGNCLYFYGDNYGNDLATIVICDNLGFCDTTHLYLHVTDGVWPGDTDDDTYVNNFDLLNIGLAFGDTGPPRSMITNVWNGYVTPLWNTTTPVSNIDYRHVDSDGDGIISSLDTIAIIQNYGLNYQKSGTGMMGGIPIKVGVDIANNAPHYCLPILLGDASNPVSSLYGGAFSISYDTTLIKVDSIYIAFDTSWVGEKGVDMITLQKNLPNDSQIDAAFTRIDGNNVNGFGIIGKLNFTIKDDILQRPSFNTDSVWLQFQVFDTKFIRVCHKSVVIKK